MSKAVPFFTTNHSEAGGGDFKPLEIGEYEVICSKVEVGKSQSGNDKINMELTVREDVNQTGKKRKIFHTLTFTDKTKGIVQGALKAFGIADGTSFANLGELAKAFQFKPVRLKNKHDEYEKNGETKVTDRVAYFMPTQYPLNGTVLNPSDDPFAGDGTPVDINEDDLPF